MNLIYRYIIILYFIFSGFFVSAQESFYSKQNSFEETLISSFEKVEDYERKNGQVFLVTNEIFPQKPEFISFPVNKCSSIFIRSNYESGYKEMWHERVMIPSMQFNLGEPSWKI